MKKTIAHFSRVNYSRPLFVVLVIFSVNTSLLSISPQYIIQKYSYEARGGIISRRIEISQEQVLYPPLTPKDKPDVQPRASEEESILEIRISPNPNRGEFNIEVLESSKEGTNPQYFYELFNTRGVEIQRGYIERGLQKMDISGLCPGIYYIRICGQLLSIVKI